MGSCSLFPTQSLKLFSLILAGLLAAMIPDARAQSPSAEARIDRLINEMSLEEQFWQLFMIPGDPGTGNHDYSKGIFGLQVPPAATPARDAARINRVQRYFADSTRLGIPIIPFEEALHGLKRPGATAFPQAIALAAAWDTTLMRRVATAIARETRSRGIRQVLSPVVNIASDVRWGRTEETYGEDPYLTSAMARAFVRSFEEHGVITTPKHFVANVGAGGRDSWPINLNERFLSEVHYPPFRAAFDAGARSVMTAYNSVDGVPATQNRGLLSRTLKRQWNFPGFIISDAAATGGATVLHMTEPDVASAAAHAYRAGLDVVFQTAWPQHRGYLRAFEEEMVPDSVTHAALRRVLTAKQQLGLFNDPYVNPDSAAYWNGHPAHHSLAREAAAAAMVLLKNRERTLPLSPADGTIALIGEDAAEVRLGGYSGPGVAPVSMLEAFRERLGDRLHYAPGPGRSYEPYRTVPAKNLQLTASYFDNPAMTGTPVATRTEADIDVRWTFNAPAPGLSTDWYGVRWEGQLTVGSETVTRLGVEGSDGWRLYLDDRLIIDNSRKRSHSTRLAELNLEAGSTHTIRLEYKETTGNARLRLVWDGGVPTDQQIQRRIDRAAALAKASDVAVVAAGIKEGEFQDRARLGLPGRQEELIRAVAATGTPMVVVLVGGSAVTMPWLEQAEAIVMAWYAGEQGGHAVADVLFGDVNPSGRLPVTFPRETGQLPLVYNHRPTGRGNDYLDLTGKPLFPFGFGLSYTTFSYDQLTITPDTLPSGKTALIQARIRNTGDRAGHEVVQLYIRDMLSQTVQPVLALKGFKRIHLEPGEVKTVRFQLGPEALQVTDPQMNRVVEPGAFRIYLGTSSEDIRLRGTLQAE